MGTFKKYRPYYALNSLRFTSGAFDNQYNSSSYYASNDSKSRVPNFKDISGVEYGWLKNMASYAIYSPSGAKTLTVSGIPNVSVMQGKWLGYQYQPFISLEPFATHDLLSDYDIEDYDYRQNMVGVTYCQKAMYVARDVNKILYSMSIFNDNVDAFVANTNSIWQNDTYYSYDSVNDIYTLVTEEPIDWSITYTDYFVLSPASDITVSCIKFRIPMLADSSNDRSYAKATDRESSQSSLSSSPYGGIVPIYCLLCSYFLDQPITIHPGDSYLLSLSFESSQF